MSNFTNCKWESIGTWSYFEELSLLVEKILKLSMNLRQNKNIIFSKKISSRIIFPENKMPAWCQINNLIKAEHVEKKARNQILVEKSSPPNPSLNIAEEKFREKPFLIVETYIYVTTTRTTRLKFNEIFNRKFFSFSTKYY